MKAETKMKGLNPQEILLLVEAMLRNGRTLAQVREAVGDTMGVKCHAIVFLNLAFPQLRLLQRLTADATAPDWIPFQRLNGATLIIMRQRAIASELEEYNRKHPSTPRTKLTAQDVIDFIEESLAEKNTVKLSKYDLVKRKLDVLDDAAREKVCEHFLKVLKEL